MAFKMVKNTLVGVKAETTQGTPVAITTSDYMLVSDVTWTPTTTNYERDYYRGSNDSLTSIITSAEADITIKTELRNSGSLGYPELEALFGATMTATSTNASSTSSVVPISTPPTGMLSNGTSVSVWVHEDGNVHKVYGALGTCKLSYEVQKPVMFEATLKGIISGSGVEAMANPTPVGLVTSNPPVCQSIGLTIGSYAPVGVDKMEISFDGGLSNITDMNAVNGIYAYVLSGNRKITVTFDTMYDTLTNHNPLADMLAGNTFAVSAKVGSVAGNQTLLSFPMLQITAVKSSKVNGFYKYNLTCEARGTGNDAFSLKLF